MKGVYSTIHLDSGDIDTTEVEHIDMEGCDLTLTMTMDPIPRDGKFDQTTLHVGPLTVRLPVAPTKVRRGDTVTVIQRVTIEELGHA